MNFPLREEKPAMTWQEGTTALAQDKSVKSVQSVVDEEEKLPTAGMIPIGQVDNTYIIAQDGDSLYIVDQHAAHEKVLFERTMAKIKDKEFTSQIISPPIVLSLDARETEMLEKYREQIERLGYEVEHFGGKEYMISAIPDNLYKIDMKDLFIEMLDDFSDMTGRETPDLILEKVASMSCKAAVKGNDELSSAEMDELIEELLTLDNPYNCPHGRPTIISMSKYEIEKKFKRIV